MSEIAGLPDGWVITLVLVKGLLAFMALIFTVLNMVTIWRYPETAVSRARRARMYGLLAAALLICWGSSEQMTRLTDPGARVEFVLGYQHLFSMLVCLMFIYAQWCTWREDIARRELVM